MGRPSRDRASGRRGCRGCHHAPLCRALRGARVQGRRGGTPARAGCRGARSWRDRRSGRTEGVRSSVLARGGAAAPQFVPVAESGGQRSSGRRPMNHHAAGKMPAATTSLAASQRRNWVIPSDDRGLPGHAEGHLQPRDADRVDHGGADGHRRQRAADVPIPAELRQPADDRGRHDEPDEIAAASRRGSWRRPSRLRRTRRRREHRWPGTATARAHHVGSPSAPPTTRTPNVWPVNGTGSTGMTTWAVSATTRAPATISAICRTRVGVRSATATGTRKSARVMPRSAAVLRSSRGRAIVKRDSEGRSSGGATSRRV